MKYFLLFLVLVFSFSVHANFQKKTTTYSIYHLVASSYNKSSDKVEVVHSRDCDMLVFLQENSIKIIDRNDATYEAIFYIGAQGEEIKKKGYSVLSYKGYTKTGKSCEIDFLAYTGTGKQGLQIIHYDMELSILYFIKPVEY